MYTAAATIPQRRAAEAPNVLGLLVIWLVLFALAVGNSVLFFFVAWNDFDPADTYSVLFFVVSGAAHLLYFVLPWYMREVISPALQLGADDYRGRGGDSAVSASILRPLLGIFSCFGAGLCVTALSLWVFHANLDFEALLSGDVAREMAMITEANCSLIGGTPEYRDGKLTCRMY